MAVSFEVSFGSLVRKSRSEVSFAVSLAVELAVSFGRCFVSSDGREGRVSRVVWKEFCKTTIEKDLKETSHSEPAPSFRDFEARRRQSPNGRLMQKIVAEPRVRIDCRQERGWGFAIVGLKAQGCVPSQKAVKRRRVDQLTLPGALVFWQR